jgi:hypothetical protein
MGTKVVGDILVNFYILSYIIGGTAYL